MGGVALNLPTLCRRVGEQVARYLLPVFCLGCGAEGIWLCASCRRRCPPVPIQRCPFCQTVSPFGETCRRCRRRRSLGGVTVRGRYRDWAWRELVRAWKYGGADGAGEVCRELFAELAPFLPRSEPPPLVVPVPLGRRRLRDRGFNQSAVLAGAFDSAPPPPAGAILCRVRETEAQAQLSSAGRQQNVAGCFRCLAPRDVRGRRCLLVDDVVTTGATLEAAARTLRGAGAADVWAAVLLRSEPGDR